MEPVRRRFWLHYHQFLSIKDGEVLSARGFGGRARAYSGIRKLAHIIMQRRYRQMGDGEHFIRYDELARELALSQGRAYDLDLLRQTLTASLVQSMFAGKTPSNPVVCIIGDGFGSLASLLLEAGFVSKVILVNLTKTLSVDLIYILKANPYQIVALPGTREELSHKTIPAAKVIAIRARDFRWLREFDVDLVFNVASMQEMNPEVIGEYFKEIRIIAQRRDVFFYCCNRQDKKLPDGTRTRFMEYPWTEEDEIYLDEKCPWHQEYYTIFPPGYHPYDGPIWHRFVKMSPDFS